MEQKLYFCSYIGRKEMERLLIGQAVRTCGFSERSPITSSSKDKT